MRSLAIHAGDVFVSPGVQMFIAHDCDYRGDPTIERWAFAHAEDDPHHGFGHLEVTVLEIVPSVSSGTLAVYRKQWITPEGEPLNAGRRCVGGLASLKALISRRQMFPAKAIEARSDETRSGSAVGESAVAQPFALNAIATHALKESGR
jgi:hypothetical protein